MSEAEHRKKRFTGMMPIATILALLMLYVLSLGPASRLWYETSSPTIQETLEVVYLPVLWLEETPLEELLAWYVELWLP